MDNNLIQLKEYVLSLVDTPDITSDQCTFLNDIIELIEEDQSLDYIKHSVECIKTISTQLLNVIEWMEQPEISFVDAMIKSSGVELD